MSLRQTVDLVVEQDDVQIDVAADGMDEVVAADGQRVAVTRGYPHRQTRVGRLDARSHGVRTTVDRVEAERLHVVDEARRADRKSVV